MEDLSSFSRRSRMQIDETNFQYTRFEESLVHPMRPILDAHTDLQSAYSNLDYLINDVVMQNEWLLNSKTYLGRFLNRLRQEEEKLQNLKEQLKKDYYEIDNNPEIYKLQKEMESYVMQTEAISRYSLQLETQKDQYKKTFFEEKEKVDNIKEELKEITKKNLKISYAIEELKPKFDSTPSKSKFPSLSFRVSTSNNNLISPIKLENLNENQKVDCLTVIEEIKRIKKEIKDTKESGQHLSTLQGAFLAEQKKLEEFFQDCFELAKQKLLQNQQMPQINKRGLAGSLFFDLIQNEKANNILGALNEKTYRSAFQERDSKNILYYTVKRMIKTAKYDQRKEQISNIQLSQREFYNFTSLQVLGLLCLRNDIQVEIHLAVFPANLMHVQFNGATELRKVKNMKKSKEKV